MIYIDAERREPRAIDVSPPPVGVPVAPLALFYVHGGGWYAGSRAMLAEHLAYFSSIGHVCASVGYRTDEQTYLADKMTDVAGGYTAFVEYLHAEQPDLEKVVVLFVEASPDSIIPEYPVPFLFLLAGNENAFPPEYVHRLAGRLRAAGGDVECKTIAGVEHGFFYQLSTPGQREALAALESFLERIARRG